ncbi:major facilitator superfamily domain-containing protein [Aspergillus californicus]
MAIRTEVDLQVEQCARTLSPPPNQQPNFLQGLQLWLVGFGLSLALFLTALEVSIVSTALVTMTDELQGFSQSSWVVTAYLLTYTGFMMIWSKCGDIFGVKPSLLASLAFFIAFSGGCGAVQSMTALIICRAFQGTGAAGVNSLTFFGLLRLLPESKFDLTASLASTVMALSLMLGPLVGGAINETGDWRWVFLLNLPAGALAWLLLLVTMPSHYPYLRPQARSNATEESDKNWIWTLIAAVHFISAKQKAFFSQVDFPGASLVLAASMLLIAALQEGNLSYGWSSPVIITFFVISGVLWIAFFTWEWLLSRHAATNRTTKIQPMLPWRLTQNRVFLGVALGFFLIGASITLCIIGLPQRYQTVHGSTPLSAGVRLLAYAIAQPIGSFITSLSAGRLRVPFIFILIASIIIQIVGHFLLSTTPTTTHLWVGHYGYAILAGLGVGMALAAVYMMAPLVVAEADQSIAVGTGLQLRMLGSALGLAVATTVLNARLKGALPALLVDEAAGVEEVMESTRGIQALSDGARQGVRQVFGEAYNLQMKIAGGFSAAQILTALLIWKREGQVRYLKEEARGA